MSWQQFLILVYLKCNNNLDICEKYECKHLDFMVCLFIIFQSNSEVVFQGNLALSSLKHSSQCSQKQLFILFTFVFYHLVHIKLYTYSNISTVSINRFENKQQILGGKSWSQWEKKCVNIQRCLLAMTVDLFGHQLACFRVRMAGKLVEQSSIQRAFCWNLNTSVLTGKNSVPTLQYLNKQVL